MRIKAKHYRTGHTIQVVVTKGTIVDIEDLPESRRDQDSDLPYIAPGLVDLQINGYNNLDFNMFPAEAERVKQFARELWREGVTSSYPTVITNSDACIAEAVGAIAQACIEDETTAACIAGIHVEGPFISPVDGPRGAHMLAYVKAPDWDLFQRWQEAANGMIRIFTLSPEWPSAPEFIAKCVASGVVVSIGHTAATCEQIQAAVDAGATMSTHLGNGAHLMMARHPNYIWDQLAQESLSAGMIADGFHLPESVLKVICKVKGDKAFIVSDAVHLSGMPPGEYGYHAHDSKVVKTPEGKLYVAENPKLLAGSAQMQPWGIQHMVRSGVCRLAEAWDRASVIPAGIMGLAASKGLAVGAPADLTLFRWEPMQQELNVMQTYKGGRLVWSLSNTIGYLPQ